MMGYEREADFLLAHGADVNAKDNGGKTPLKWAEDDGHKELAEMLRQHGGIE
jgi:ankyrin repeat protein